MNSKLLWPIILLWLAVLMCARANAEGNAKLLNLKPDEELNVSLGGYHGTASLRVSTDYLCAELPEHQIVIVAEAPAWSVRATSPLRKVTAVCSLEDWVRRGSPLNFLHVTAIPEWPVIRVGMKPFMTLQATAYALPYKNGNSIVPLKRGQVGELLVLDGIPAPISRIVSTLFQTPKVNGLPVQLNIWDADRLASKMNSVFIFSGSKRANSKDLVTTKLTIVKRRPLPSVQGYRVSKNPRDVWVSSDDTEGFEQLLH